MKINIKYPEFLRMDKESQSRIVFTFLAILAFIIRIVGDVVLFYIDANLEEIQYFWNLITSGIISYLLILIAFFPFNNFFEVKNLRKDDEEFFNDLYKSIIILVISLFLTLFFGMTRTNNEEQTLLMYVSRNILSVFVLITLIYNTRLFKEWLLLRRTTKTISHIKRIVSLGLILIAIIIIGKWFDEDIKIVAGLSVVLITTVAIVMQWQISSRNDWIYNINKKSKVRLFWLSGALSFLYLIFIILTINQSSNFSFAIKSFSSISQGIIAYLLFLNFIFIVRTWFTSMSSLPNADLVERKSSELSSLAYLNQFVTESVEKDLDYLLSTVTDLAIRSSRATGGWCEIYNDNEIEIKAVEGFNPEEINRLHENEQLIEYIKLFHEPKLVQSISEDKKLMPIDSYSKKAKSVLIIPILTTNERIGTIILTNVYEFGFDTNDLMIMTAFSANMKIAIDNAKLMKDSIEKEKYKNELILAQRIQKRLLPQELPKIENYSVSAFNIPATEVGGDYYDIVYLKNNDPCIVIADVSGKGISAAFYMAQLKGVVLSVARSCNDPKELLSKVNETLYGNMEKQMYITMSAVKLYKSGGKIEFARAGHMPLILKNKDKINQYTPKGLGIGLAKKEIFNNSLDCKEIELSESDSFVLFTDGINELRIDDKGTELGYEPIENALKNINNNAENIIIDIKNDILAKKGEISGHDDMTIVAVINNFNNK